MDLSPDLILLIDRASMRFVDVNTTACSLLGYSREELLELGPQDVASRSREELERALDSGFTAEEVESGKRGLLEARRLARTQDRALTSRLASYLHLGRTLAWDIDFEKRIAALTPEQVREALRRHVDPKMLSVMKAGDFRK